MLFNHCFIKVCFYVSKLNKMAAARSGGSITDTCSLALVLSLNLDKEVLLSSLIKNPSPLDKDQGSLVRSLIRCSSDW